MYIYFLHSPIRGHRYVQGFRLTLAPIRMWQVNPFGCCVKTRYLHLLAFDAESELQGPLQKPCVYIPPQIFNETSASLGSWSGIGRLNSRLMDVPRCLYYNIPYISWCPKKPSRNVPGVVGARQCSKGLGEDAGGLIPFACFQSNPDVWDLRITGWCRS